MGDASQIGVDESLQRGGAKGVQALTCERTEISRVLFKAMVFHRVFKNSLSRAERKKSQE